MTNAAGYSASVPVWGKPLKPGMLAGGSDDGSADAGSSIGAGVRGTRSLPTAAFAAPRRLGGTLFAGCKRAGFGAGRRPCDGFLPRADTDRADVFFAAADGRVWAACLEAAFNSRCADLASFLACLSFFRACLSARRARLSVSLACCTVFRARWVCCSAASALAVSAAMEDVTLDAWVALSVFMVVFDCASYLGPILAALLQVAARGPRSPEGKRPTRNLQSWRRAPLLRLSDERRIHPSPALRRHHSINSSPVRLGNDRGTHSCRRVSIGARNDRRRHAAGNARPPTYSQPVHRPR